MDQPAAEPTAISLPGEPGLVAREITNDVWVVTHEPAFHANVLVARMQDGAVLIASSPFDTTTTNRLLSWIRERFAPARMVAVNTHFHLDGTGGNEAYRAAAVETWASTATQALLAERGVAMRERAAASLSNASLAAQVRATAVVPAERTFAPADGLLLRFGSETAEVRFPGPGHSPDNVVVHLPNREVLFGGCMIRGDDGIGNLSDADLARWEASVATLEGLAPRWVIPGHGAVGGRDLLANTRAVAARAAAARAPGAPR
jgi:metallo-beta-lactamase class B